MRKAIVIGAGIGGIATSARLAKNGFKVVVFEKNPTPGGRLSKVEGLGFRFDIGPTLYLMPNIFNETYDYLGERIEDHLNLVRIDPTYKVYLHDGLTIELSSDLKKMRDQLDSLEPGAFGSYLRFLEEAYRNYELSLRHFVGRNFIKPSDFFNLKSALLMLELKALTTHYKNISRYFHDPRLRAVFSFQNMYLGLSPFEALATYSLLQFTELVDGVWFPLGGMFRIVESLTSIAEGLGVEFRYDAEVSQIDVSNDRALGVTLTNGEKESADLIIANADLPYVYNKLLPNSSFSNRLKRKRYTSSALVFCWGVSERLPGLLHHNVFLSDHKFKESFDNIFVDLSLPEEPSFYICAPCRTDESFAPINGDSLLVLVPVGHMDESMPQNWDIVRERAKEFILSKLSSMGIADITDKILFEKTLTPVDYLRSLNLMKGSAFGLSHNLMQVGYFRPHNRHPRYRNLFFVGASTHPGTGLPIVLISARLVVERILSEK